jgi:tRNA(fMet)-specific endonuclease VapC
MVTFLLDTNALSEPVRPSPNAGFMRRLRANEGRLAIASVTLHEALYGVERLADGKRKETLGEYMRDVVTKMPALAYDGRAAEQHARERVRLIESWRA